MKKETTNQTYKQIKVLGQGSYGKAILVECSLDKSLAVAKTMQIDNLSEDEKKEAYLEAKILKKLDHPNIIKFIEVFLSTKPYPSLNIIMDYADGGDLQAKIKSQKSSFSENQILDWFTQICLAIKHIHDKKILHRDLKSGNIFLTKEGKIKLGDFGIAKCLTNTCDKAKTLVGTPYYLSPEIVQDKPYSYKSDIWSLGVLLYEMTMLKMPFDAMSLPQLSLKIVKGAYSPISSSVSKELKQLIQSLIQVEIKNRPTIYEILRNSLIKGRISNFLNEKQYESEFLKQSEVTGYKILDTKTSPEKNEKGPAQNNGKKGNLNGQDKKNNVCVVFPVISNRNVNNFNEKKELNLNNNNNNNYNNVIGVYNVYNNNQNNINHHKNVNSAGPESKSKPLINKNKEKEKEKDKEKIKEKIKEKGNNIVKEKDEKELDKKLDIREFINNQKKIKVTNNIKKDEDLIYLPGRNLFEEREKEKQMEKEREKLIGKESFHSEPNHRSPHENTIEIDLNIRKDIEKVNKNVKNEGKRKEINKKKGNFEVEIYFPSNKGVNLYTPDDGCNNETHVKTVENI